MHHQCLDIINPLTVRIALSFCGIAEHGRARVCGCHAGISGPTLLDIDGCLNYVTLLEDDKVISTKPIMQELGNWEEGLDRLHDWV